MAKSFAQFRQQPLDELTAFQDPPTVLVMRRKAIRLFPNNQRVATYRNDNLELEVAIPYDPATFGHRKTSTVGTSTANESVLDEAGQYTPEQLKIRRDRRILHADVWYNQRAVREHESKARSEFTDPKSRQKHIQSIAGARMKHEWSVKALIAHQEKHGPLAGIDHPMEESVLDEAIKGWKHAHTDIAKFRRDAGNAAARATLVRAKKDGSESGMHDATTHHKTEADARAKHEHIKSINPGRDVKHHLYVNGEHKGLLEDTCPTCHGTGFTPGQNDTVCPTCHGDPETPKLKTWDDMRKFHQSFGPAQHAISKQMRALLTGEEVVNEAGSPFPKTLKHYANHTEWRGDMVKHGATKFHSLEPTDSNGNYTHEVHAHNDAGKHLGTWNHEMLHGWLHEEAPVHSGWTVIPHDKAKHTVQFAKDKKDQAEYHAFKYGGEVHPIDQHGRIFNPKAFKPHDETEQHRHGDRTDEEVEAIDENAMAGLVAIRKTRTPATLKFRNGSGTMVHHEDAHRICALHSALNKANKRKIESLVNASPEGLKKVIEFATVHFKAKPMKAKPKSAK